MTNDDLLLSTDDCTAKIAKNGVLFLSFQPMRFSVYSASRAKRAVKILFIYYFKDPDFIKLYNGVNLWNRHFTNRQKELTTRFPQL